MMHKGVQCSLVTLGVGLVSVIGMGGAPAYAGEPRQLVDLPLAVQATVSATLGRDSAAYQMQPTRAGYHARTAAQDLRADFSPAGVRVCAAGGGCARLALDGYGYGAAWQPVQTTRPQAAANRVEYQHGAVTEWYVNGPLGVEQGFTLTAAPPRGPDGAPLTVVVGLAGGVTATAEGDGARLVRADGQAVARYRGLSAVDATGRELPVRLEARGRQMLLRVNDRGAHYPVLIDPFIQAAKLRASDGAPNDGLGASVAISGDAVVAGAPGATIGSHSHQGAAYVFVKATTGWASMTETAKLTASDGAGGDNLGTSVAISGDTVVAGAYDATIGSHSYQGAAYVFVKATTGWASMTETAKLTASDGAGGDNLGTSVAISGDTAVAGSYDATSGYRGAAYVFVKATTGWASMTETAKLRASDGAPIDYLGCSVAISGDTVVAGASSATIVGIHSYQGAAYVFQSPTSPARGINVWTSHGPYGGFVTALAIDPTTPSTLYAGTTSFPNGGGVFRSTNSGGSWSAVNTGLSNVDVRALAIDPTTPSTLYAGTGGGVYKSTNSGGGWSLSGDALDVLALAIAPTTPSTLYAGTSGNGVFQSTNSGGSWSRVNTGLSDLYVNVLAADPSTPSTLYAGTLYGGVFQSTDSGGSWSSVNTGLTDYNGTLKALAIDPSTPSTLYAGTDAGVFQSTSNGGSWSAVNTGLTDYKGTLLVKALAIDPSTSSTLYAGTYGGGVFQSTSSGGSWSPVNTGLGDLAVWALAIDPTTPSTLYAGTERDSVFQSTNSGGSWSPVNTGVSGDATFTVRALAIDPSTPSTLYAGTDGGGVFQSTNRGGSWSAVNTGLNSGNPLTVYALAIAPTTPGTLYAGIYDGGVFQSTNSGGSWSNTGLGDLTVYALAIDPTTPSTLYAGTLYGGVFRSTNSGGSWSAVNTGLSRSPFGVRALAIDPTRPSTLYAGIDWGVFRSTNSGGSWSAVNTGLNSGALVIAPTTPSTLYAGTFDEGVFQSTNSGGNWSAVNTGLGNLEVYALAIDPTTPSTLYAGTGGGVFSIKQVSVCVGDCNGDGQVTVNEILTMVNIALGNTPVGDCLAGDVNDDRNITVDEILTAVNNALNGCGG